MHVFIFLRTASLLLALFTIPAASPPWIRRAQASHFPDSSRSLEWLPAQPFALVRLHPVISRSHPDAGLINVNDAQQPRAITNPQAPALLQNAITACAVRFDFSSDLCDLFLREGFDVHAERYCLIYQISSRGKKVNYARGDCLFQHTDGRERPCNVAVCKLFVHVFTCTRLH